MSVFPEHELQTIPQLEDSSVKEVFSFFGLCMYNAQVLERGIINLTIGLRVKSLTQITSEEIDHLFDKSGSKTLGQLIFDLRKKHKVSKDFEDSLMKAKDHRNYIAHTFFYHHSSNFLSDTGRSEMIQELRKISGSFHTLDRSIDKITHKLWEKLGITKEMVDAELEKKKSESDE